MKNKLIDMPPLILKQFIEMISKGVYVSCEIEFKNTSYEKAILEKFCESKISTEIRSYAWREIIDYFDEFLYDNKIDDIKNTEAFFTEKTLNFLIDNEIALISLGHLQLSDYWLQKIYDKDNRCTEALQTIEERKKINTHDNPK